MGDARDPRRLTRRGKNLGAGVRRSRARSSVGERAAGRGRTLVMDGGASPAWMRDITRSLAAALPAGAHRTLPDQTNDVAPGALAAALEDFLR